MALLFGKTLTSNNWVLVFFWKKTHPENIEIVEDLIEKLQQQRQTLEIVEDFACEAKNLINPQRVRIFECFFNFLDFFIFPFFLFFFLWRVFDLTLANDLCAAARAASHHSLLC